jgi:CRISPR/Cas system-associated exonuclease Cas4 (RecB family)
MSILEEYFRNGRPLSSSTLKTFFSCPRKFYFKTIGLEEQEIGSQLVLGTSVHHACDEYYKGRPIVSIDKAVHTFIRTYDTEANQIKQNGKKLLYTSSSPGKDKRDGGSMIEMFLKEYKDLNVVASECGMYVTIPVNGYNVVTYAGIDLVIDEGDGYVLADIKTGKSGATPIYMKEDLQLNQYVYVFSRGEFGEIDHKIKRMVPYQGIFDPKSKPVKAKVIFNIRGFLKQSFCSHTVEYRSEEFNEQGFLLAFQTGIKEMELYYNIGYWPKRGVKSLHDSQCQFCSYRNQCIKET